MKKYTPRKLSEAWYYLDMSESCSNILAFGIIVLVYPIVRVFSVVNNLIFNYKHKKMKTINLIKQWVRDRNLHTADPRVQMCKLMEEVGELANCINKDKRLGAMDGIGDSVVVLVCLCEQLGLEFDDCVAMAYEEIKDRKGKLINGTFVKEEDLVVDGEKG